MIASDTQIEKMLATKFVQNMQEQRQQHKSSNKQCDNMANNGNRIGGFVKKIKFDLKNRTEPKLQDKWKKRKKQGKNMKILMLNGVNMNMLGKRDTSLYGSDTLSQLENKVQNFAETLGVQLECKQSNCEGTLVDILQQTDADGVVLNAGAYSHYSLALRDCIECIALPVVEVHMTNVYLRESFRHVDVLKDVCAASFVGKGLQSYLEAVQFLAEHQK